MSETFKMEKLEQSTRIPIRCGGIARTADFVTAGTSQITLGESGKYVKMKRIRQGFYQPADDDSLSEAQTFVRSFRRIR